MPFRKGRFCADLLTATVDDWLLAHDRKLTIAIVLLDLSKAFDKMAGRRGAPRTPMTDVGTETAF